ncbi:universal stress protein [Thermovibrio sp.]
MLFEKVLYPFDMRKASLKVKPYVMKLKEAGCREVHVIYVMVPSEWGLLSREEFDCEEKIEALKGTMDEGFVSGLLKIFRKMKEVATEFEENGVKTRVVLVPGELDETLAWYADKYGIKLIALGVTSESLSFFRVGKILDIIKAVSQPVLIVKTPEEEDGEV